MRVAQRLRNRDTANWTTWHGTKATPKDTRTTHHVAMKQPNGWGCKICSATFGNAAQIFMIRIPTDPIAYSEVEDGRITSEAVLRQIDGETTPRLRSTTSDCALRNRCSNQASHRVADNARSSLATDNLLLSLITHARRGLSWTDLAGID